ncbi:hypothetical protein [Armatimonas sp.]|uniref:hypothetical protein n=1 Tax=Armatimonas sp. TaxID=1872638 RepID=UPI00286B4E01|nr:hypothetical protein [Armatimonas sp.]
MALTRRQSIAAGAVTILALALTEFICYTQSSHQTPPSLPALTQLSVKRIPKLDNRIQSWTGAWLGNDRVITGIPAPFPGFGPEVCAHPDIFDLSTHSHYPLPKLRQRKEEESSEQNTPYPSPDGKWLLYTEYQGNQTSKTRIRQLRLLHPDGNGTRVLPFPEDAENLEPHWLADSSGWIANGYKLSNDKGATLPIAYRFDLVDQENSPQELSLTRFSNLETITHNADLIFNGKYSFRHESVSLNAPSIRPEPLDIRQGDLEAFWPGHHGGPWPLQLSRDGSFLLVRGYSPSLGRQSAGLWRIPIPAGAPERLPLTGDVEDFALSPNGKKVLYWQRSESGTHAYLLTLTERKA